MIVEYAGSDLPRSAALVRVLAEPCLLEFLFKIDQRAFEFPLLARTLARTKELRAPC